jgi:hypothetical protein
MEYKDDYPEELQIREREIAHAKKVIKEQKNAHEEQKKVIKENDYPQSDRKKCQRFSL